MESRRLSLVAALALAASFYAVAAFGAESAGEDVAAKIRLYPINTQTLSERMVLRGETAGKPAVIAGELRLPRATGRVAVVILIHGSGGKEVRAVFPPWRALIYQSKEGFVHQAGGLQCLRRWLAAQMAGGKAPELLVYKWRQVGERAWIAGTPGDQ